jgi:L-iditol 2-dehydrogenase
VAGERQNRAAVLLKKDDLVLKQVPMPAPPRPNEVTIEMKAVGICGSDVHYWTHGAIGDFVVKAPMIIGHECAGRVVAVGSAVKHLSVGDRVALEPGVPCRQCNYCRSGTYNLCPDIAFFATPPFDGSLINYLNHAADFCFKLPENVSYEEGALCEPLSVGVYACQRVRVQPGHRVIIFGAGPIGLVCMMVARAFGAKYVVITDVAPSRLATAKKFGADAVVNATNKSSEALSDEVRTFIGGDRYDVAFECCGIESATQCAIKSTASGGTVCIIGMGNPDMKLPVFTVGVREVDMRGIFRYRNTYPTCIDLIANGKVNVREMVTHRFKIDEVLEAFAVSKEGRDGAIKVMFVLE